MLSLIQVVNLRPGSFSQFDPHSLESNTQAERKVAHPQSKRCGIELYELTIQERPKRILHAAHSVYEANDSRCILLYDEQPTYQISL